MSPLEQLFGRARGHTSGDEAIEKTELRHLSSLIVRVDRRRVARFSRSGACQAIHSRVATTATPRIHVVARPLLARGRGRGRSRPAATGTRIRQRGSSQAWISVVFIQIRWESAIILLRFEKIIINIGTKSAKTSALRVALGVVSSQSPGCGVFRELSP
jgi:hypothetical protein